LLVISQHPDSQQNLKITDFGTSRASAKHASRNQLYQSTEQILSKAENEKARKLTKGVGTLIYQAPEIMSGKSDYVIDKTDVFSFGVMLWQVFTQIEPFSQPPYDTWGPWGESHLLFFSCVHNLPN
jgi:serine/threonine protein kinase